MRKLIVVSMTTLDGVIQGPGAPGEDTSGGFQWGGWVAPYDDEAGNTVLQNLMQPADLLLGRKTFQIWEAYWPTRERFWPGINEVTKYVLSTTVHASHWQGCVFLNNLAAVETLKATDGPDIKIWGSSKLVQSLLQHDLVDELWLMLYPLTLGNGKKLFENSAIPAAFALAECTVTTTGVIMAHYKRAGKVVTGTAGA